MFETCPTDIVEAPAAAIWPLLTDPQKLETWVDARLKHGPGRVVQPGDVLSFRSGPLDAMQVRFVIGAMTPPHEIAIRVELPFGIVNAEVVRVTPMGPSRCRVTLN